MNKYIIYDKNDGTVKGTFSKYHWSKEEPIPLTEEEVREEFKEEFSEGMAIAKIPEHLVKPEAGAKLKFDLEKKQVIMIKREDKPKNKAE